MFVLTLISLATLACLTKANEISIFAVYPTVLNKNGTQLKLTQFDWHGNVNYSATSSITLSGLMTILEPSVTLYLLE